MSRYNGLVTNMEIKQSTLAPARYKGSSESYLTALNNHLEYHVHCKGNNGYPHDGKKLLVQS